MDSTYVSLDLELLDSTLHGREIVEIGAVRFRGSQELATYTALVRTAAPLSHRLARLTGIDEGLLSTAIPLDRAIGELREFLGSSPIVGQSIELDAEHLRKAGLSLRAPLLDTFELAQLLAPGLPRYDLASVARTLGVVLDDDLHRALADARLAMRVFNQLVARIRALDLDTLGHIGQLSRTLNWPLRTVFAQVERDLTREYQLGPGGRSSGSRDIPAWLAALGEAPRAKEGLVPNERPAPLDVDRLAEELSEGGDVAVRLDGFEERVEQVEMLRAVAGAFNDSDHLLVEAGTGTGKSLAYLLPAIRYAYQNGCRVVVSTNTINLQDQLSQKELPTLRQATRLPFRYSLLKGRTNYLCLRRWLTLLRSDDLAPEERSLLIKTLLWLPHTESGDRAELRLVGREEDAWLKVCALADACSPQRCAYNRAGRCFLAKARRVAESCHVLVVNHSLLLADLATRSRVLPEYRHLIVDEAHHLEDEATSQLGWHVGQRDLLASLERLWETGPRDAGGLIPQALYLLRRAGGKPDAALGSGPDFAALDRLSSELGFVIGDLVDELPATFALIGGFAAAHGQRGEIGGTVARLSSAMRAQPAWSGVEAAWDQQQQRLLRLQRLLSELLRLVEQVSNGEKAEWEELSGELAVQATYWDTIGERLGAVLSEHDPALVSWLTVGRNEEVYLSAAPLHVGDHLRTGLFDDKECVVLTSATLTADQSFRYIRQRLGIEHARELMLGSPFDYRQAAMVYLPADLPEPNAPGYQASVERITGQVIAALDGRTLVLFTSNNQLRATYQALKAPLEERQIALLGQRMDGASRARLLETFKTGDRVALMGTTSFWEGVDVVGEALSCLIIARLPFTTPSDPVFQARSEQFDEPFSQYAVPQAILRFRQGFGRLIRSRSDRGVVVVLDRRLKSRAYGRAFLRSLPGCIVREGPSSKAASAVMEWLAGSLAGAGAD